MRYAVIDCENSGLFDFSKPADAPGQPRLAELGIIIVEENKETGHLHEVSRRDFLIKPEGWEMTPEASSVNGLTTEILLERGVPIHDVLLVYSGLILAGYAIASFNSQFDCKQMRAELRRAGMDDLFEKTFNVCLMRASTDVCRIPKKTGKGYKFPKLSEACAFFKIEPEPTPHRAIHGAERAAKILIALQGLARLPAPDVHYAKERPPESPPKPTAGPAIVPNPNEEKF